MSPSNEEIEVREQAEAGPSNISTSLQQSNSGSEEPLSTKIRRRILKVRKIRRPDDVSLGEEAGTPSEVEGQMAENNQAGPSRSRSRSASPLRKKKESRLEEKETHRRSLSPTPQPISRSSPPPHIRPTRKSHLAPSRTAHPPLLPCRSVYSYTRLNHIEEGTYGVVFRARCNDTNQIFALKKLKLEEEKQGFPITSLREIMALMIAGDHPNVVGIREIVVGETLNQYV